MKSYFLPSRFFRKKWVWFEKPQDVEGADMVTFFSYDDVEVPGFKKSSDLTSVIDLSRSEEEIRSNMREQFMRLQIDRGLRRGISARQDNSYFNVFKPIYERFRELKKLPSESWSVIEKNGTLFCSFYEQKLMSGMVCVEDGKSMRLWKLASVRLEEEDKLMQKIAGEANRIVIWEAIRFAKANGYALFDLGGINPDSNDSGVRAVAQFKEAFGGERKSSYYYTKVYSPLLYVWMRARSKLFA